MPVRRLLPLLLVVACGGGEVRFPEGVDTSYARLHGTSVDDMWWPDCVGQDGLTLWHGRGGAWSAVTVPEYQCGIMQGAQIPMAPGGPGALWISGVMADVGSYADNLTLLRVTADGDVEDHTADLGVGVFPWALASSGPHMYAVAYPVSGEPETLVHYVDGDLQESIPLPPRPEGEQFPQAPQVAVDGPADLFIDYGRGPCVGEPCLIYNILWHFDGQEWSSADGPPVGVMGRGFPPDDIWAINGMADGSPEAWHWDGTAWTLEPLPLLGILEDTPDKEAADTFLMRGLSSDAGGNPVAVIGFNPMLAAIVEAEFEVRGDVWRRTGTILANPPRSGCTGYGPCGANVDGRFEDGSMALLDWGYNREPKLVLWRP